MDQETKDEDKRNRGIGYILKSTVFSVALTAFPMFTGCAYDNIRSPEKETGSREVYSIEYQQEGPAGKYDVQFSYYEDVPLSDLSEKFLEELEEDKETKITEEEFNYMEASMSGGDLPPGGISVKILDIEDAHEIGDLKKNKYSKSFEELEADSDIPDLINLSSSWAVGLSETVTKGDAGSKVELETNLKDIQIDSEDTENLKSMTVISYRKVRKGIYRHIKEDEKYRPDAVKMKNRLVDILGL